MFSVNSDVMAKCVNLGRRQIPIQENMLQQDEALEVAVVPWCPDRQTNDLTRVLPSAGGRIIVYRNSSTIHEQIY